MTAQNFGHPAVLIDSVLGTVGFTSDADVNGDLTVNALDYNLAFRSRGRRLANGLKLG